MEGSELERKSFWNNLWKIAVTYIISAEAISGASCCYFLVETALWMALINYLLSEAAAGIDEKATEEISDQNMSNTEFLTTDAAHTPMTPPFLLLFGVSGRF